MRPRIKTKAGLQGSSDFSRVVAHKHSLEQAHKEFVGSKLHINLMAVSTPEPAPNRLVKITVWGREMIVPYSKAKAIGADWRY